MRIVCALLFSCVLCSCTSSPQPGDVYANRESGERVTITATGPCLALRDSLQAANAQIVQQHAAGSLSDAEALAQMRPPVLSADSMATDCVAYDETVVLDSLSLPGFRFRLDGEYVPQLKSTVSRIVSAEELDSLYVRSR